MNNIQKFRNFFRKYSKFRRFKTICHGDTYFKIVCLVKFSNANVTLSARERVVRENQNQQRIGIQGAAGKRNLLVSVLSEFDFFL